MTSSGTYLWQPPASDIVMDAFQRIQIRGPELTTNGSAYMAEATRSLNTELSTWATRGVNLWAVQEGITISLVAPTGEIGQAVYTLPSNIAYILNVRYNIPQTGGGTIDRLMLPIGRDDYAAYPNKLTAGTPTVYWFQRLIPPQITIWQPDATGSPNTLTYDALRIVQDASIANGQTVDMPTRFMDALMAKLAWRLARKFWSDLVAMKKMSEEAALKMISDLKEEAEEAWQLAALDDQETADLQFAPDVSDYFRMM